jgi:hypothetical protein
MNTVPISYHIVVAAIAGFHGGEHWRFRNLKLSVPVAAQDCRPTRCRS